MKTIWLYVREYFQQEWDARYFATVGVFLGAAFYLNYGFDLETTILKQLSHPLSQTGFYFLFFTISYFIVLCSYGFYRRDFAFFRERRFWLASGVFFPILAIYIALHNTPWYALRNYPELFQSIPSELHFYAVRYSSNILPGAVTLIPIYLYWYFNDRQTMPLYGVSAAHINLRTYVLILLLLVPVILAASFERDFQAAYPRYKFGLPMGWGSQPALIAGFQVCYGLDFVVVEFLFRGFMILAFARVLGTGAIVPMVVVYALIHFQKPLGEALGSIFGGLVLGVISYRTKSIYGGVILHLGVAYLMEIAGSLHWSPPRM